MTFAEAAERAIELGGKFSGKEAPERHQPDDQGIGCGAGRHRAGRRRQGQAAQAWPRPGALRGLLHDRARHRDRRVRDQGVSRRRRLRHGPASARACSRRCIGGATMGFGLATTERIVYDHALGLPANVQFDQSKPPTFLDMPKNFHWSAVENPDRDNPVGVKGIGEPIQGAAGVGVDQRDLRRAWRPLLPPDSGGPRHDHQRACQTPAVVPGAAGQHDVMKEPSHDDQGCHSGLRTVSAHRRSRTRSRSSTSTRRTPGRLPAATTRCPGSRTGSSGRRWWSI